MWCSSVKLNQADSNGVVRPGVWLVSLDTTPAFLSTTTIATQAPGRQ